MDGGFITGFQGFAAAEATHYPALAGPLGRLVAALESVEPGARTPGPPRPAAVQGKIKNFFTLHAR